MTTFCDLFAGTLDATGGICELGVLTAPLAVPLGLMASTFSIAGAFFKEGKWLEGGLTLLIGGIITAVVSHFMKAALKKAFQALMNTVKTAFQATNAPFFSNPFTVALAVAVGILISTLFAQAVSNLMGFEQGGFIDHNKPLTIYDYALYETCRNTEPTFRERRNAAMNEQIVEAVQIGVSQAWVAAMHDNCSNGSAIARVFLDGREIARSTSV